MEYTITDGQIFKCIRPFSLSIGIVKCLEGDMFLVTNQHSRASYAWRLVPVNRSGLPMKSHLARRRYGLKGRKQLEQSMYNVPLLCETGMLAPISTIELAMLKTLHKRGSE